MAIILGQRDLIKVLAFLFDKYKVNYLLTGSLAGSYYGYPRATHDIDFILEIDKKDSDKLIKALKKLGKPFIIDEDEINEAVRKSFFFDLYHPETGIKIDFWFVIDDEFEKNKFKRRKEILFEKQPISLISAEDLILTKLLWCKEIKSERHMRDCVGILEIQKNKLNNKYLYKWAERLKIKDLLKEASEMKYSF